MLRTGGYTVLEAAHAEEAQALAAQYAGQIHLLVTDVVMPGLSGPQLAGQLRAARPGLRVLCISGYAEEAALRMVPEASPDLPVMAKPFTWEALSRRVRKILDGTADAAALHFQARLDVLEALQEHF